MRVPAFNPLITGSTSPERSPVFTSTGWKRPGADGVLDRGDRRQPVAVAVGNCDLVLVDDPEVILDEAEHVEALEERRRVMEPAEG